MKEHEFMLKRDGRFESIFAHVTLQTELTHPEEAWNAFRSGITAWVRHAEAGRNCWEESSHDLNVGDLLNHGAAGTKPFQYYLAEAGIAKVTLRRLDGIARDYDEVLVNREELVDDEQES